MAGKRNPPNGSWKSPRLLISTMSEIAILSTWFYLVLVETGALKRGNGWMCLILSSPIPYQYGCHLGRSRTPETSKRQQKTQRLESWNPSEERRRRVSLREYHTPCELWQAQPVLLFFSLRTMLLSRDIPWWRESCGLIVLLTPSMDLGLHTPTPTYPCHKTVAGDRVSEYATSS